MQKDNSKQSMFQLKSVSKGQAFRSSCFIFQMQSSVLLTGSVEDIM